MSSRPVSVLVKGRKISALAVGVAKQIDSQFPIPVYSLKNKIQRSASAGTELHAKAAVPKQKKPAAKPIRPLSGAETERLRVNKSEIKASFRPKSQIKPSFSRVVPTYKSNKPDPEPVPEVPASPDPPTSRLSMRVIIGETLKKERESKEKRFSAVLESLAKEEEKKTQLKQRNERIREENCRKFKAKSFKPVSAWGSDERKILGVEEERIRKQAQEDRERRRALRSSAKSSLGLEVYHQIKNEVLQMHRVPRGSSSIPSPLPLETKPIRSPDPYLQAYIHFKKRMIAEEAFTEALLSQEAETRRVMQLKHLEARERIQLERFKYRQIHHKKKLKRRRKRQPKAWESSSIPPSEPEDSEVKMIMEQIDDDSAREQPLEGRECRLFGRVEGDHASLKLTNATQIGNEVVERVSTTPKIDVPRASVSMPNIQPPSDSYQESGAVQGSGRIENRQNRSFNEEGSQEDYLGLIEETEEQREIQRKKEEIRKRLTELRSRVDRVRETVIEDSYRPSIREETSEEHLGSSDDGQHPAPERFSESDSLLVPMEPAHRVVHIPQYSDSLRENQPDEDPPHFPGQISNIEPKPQDSTPPPGLIKTRIFEPLIAQNSSRDSKADLKEKLTAAKDEEMMQLQTIANQFQMGERMQDLEALTKNIEDRYQLLARLLDEVQDKKQDEEAVNILGELSPIVEPLRPVAEYVSSSGEEEGKSIHSPDLSEIKADERRDKDKTSEISGDLRFSFSERAIFVETEAIKEESQRPSLGNSGIQVIERVRESPEPAESGLLAFYPCSSPPLGQSFLVDSPLISPSCGQPILIEDWGESSSSSSRLPDSSFSERKRRFSNAGMTTEAVTDLALDHLIWEIVNLPVMKQSVESTVDDVTERILRKLIDEVQIEEGRKSKMDLDAVVNVTLEEAFKMSKAVVMNLGTPVERDPLDLLLTLQETEVGQMILDDPFAPSILPARILSEIEQIFPSSEAERPLFRLVFDVVNEAMQSHRHCGVKGVPLPWSKAARTVSNEISLEEVDRKVKERLRIWEHMNVGKLPSSDLQFPSGQIDEDMLQTKREENLATALVQDLREKEPMWTDYEAEETQVKLDLADMVLDHIITELFQIAGMAD